MSVKVMSLVWDHYPGGGGELLLALALADWANHDGQGIWAAVGSMADKTRQSERTVQYQLRRMQASGWVQMIGEGKGGRAKSTDYRIPIERIPPNAGRVQKLHPLEVPKGCNPAQERVQSSAGKGATAIAPDPLSKPSSKPSGRAARATRLPSDWVLPKTWGEWALTEQPTWTPEHVRKVALIFFNHWTSTGKNATKTDWFKTWQNWILKEPALKGTTLNGRGQPWFLKASGIEAKGREQGKTVPEDKMLWPSFMASVLKDAGITEEMLKAARADA